MKPSLAEHWPSSEFSPLKSYVGWICYEKICSLYVEKRDDFLISVMAYNCPCPPKGESFFLKIFLKFVARKNVHSRKVLV